MTTAHSSGSGDVSRSLELLWRGREQAARGPKPALTLERLVAAAVALADRDGLAALSMRKVAAELGVGTMSLYRYVPGKSELLDLMLDHVQGPPADLDEHRGKPWREVLRLIAESLWELHHEHPWLLQVNQSRPVLGPNGLAGFDFAMGALDGLGLTARERLAAIMALESYVTATARTFVLQQRATAETGMTDEEFWNAQAPILTEALSTGAYPAVAALPEDTFNITPQEALELGLTALLDGLERLVTSRR